MMTNETMWTVDKGRAAVRVEDVYSTSVEDVWDACTSRERLARWIAQVSGPLAQGETLDVVFTSGWSGRARVDVCEAPRRLTLTLQPGTDDESQIEVDLTPHGSETRLALEHRNLAADALEGHGAGWRIHLRDLGAGLVSEGPVHGSWSGHSASPGWVADFVELIGPEAPGRSKNA